MHVSGIEYAVDVSRAFNAGENFRDRIWYTAASVERVTITSINGRPFDENALYAVITSNANFNGMDISYVLNERPSDTENWSTITTARVVDHAVAMYIAQLPNATIGAERGALQNRITEYATVDSAILYRFAPTALTALDIPSFADDGGLVPLRVVAEGLGAVVRWNAQDSSITIILDGKIIYEVYEPFIVNSRAFVTVEHIKDIFRFNI
jgi:hypothetical protein